MRKLVLSAASLTLLAAPAQVAPIAAQTAPAAVAGVPVRDNGLVGTWFAPASGRPGPVLIVIGGSEGGERGARGVGAAFAHQGYGVLALAWFQAEGLPPTLQEIPLEYFTKAVDWVAAQPLAAPGRIGMFGISKGGEAVLLVASRDPRIRAVVAGVPSSVVWQGINMADWTSVKSSFSAGGAPVAFVPYDDSQMFTGILDLYQRSLKRAAEHPDAAIPVERIAGPVLLLSGRDDKLWPSSEMSDQVIARLDAKGFAHKRRHIAYEGAGHLAAVPLPPGAPPALASLDTGGLDLGGTPEANAAARADAWKQVTAFFAESLGAPQ